LDGESEIWNIQSIETITELYNYVLKEQKVGRNGLFKDETPTSLWANMFYSAALGSYKNFLTHNNLKSPIPNENESPTSKEKIKSIITKSPFSIDNFKTSVEKSGLVFSEKLIIRFVSSLLTKPFVILTGLSGSGKTKLAQCFVHWICESKEQYKIVPVGADWTNREPLLGFPNGLDEEKYVLPDSGALQLLINALNPVNMNKPYFLILDEMNLSHVERYFADFLSIMESKDEIKLYSGTNRKCSEGKTIKKEVSWPKNLFIIGTVNVDETTYMFSPKVLDRANVIEFRVSETDMGAYLKSTGELNMNKFFVDEDNDKAGFGSNMAADFLEKAMNKATPQIKTEEILVEFFKKLEKAGAEFGYRSASEINRLVAMLESLIGIDKKWDEVEINGEKDFIDIAIMQKLLPKLHGSRNKMTKVLPVLGELCLKNIEKIKENYFEKFDSIDFNKNENIKYKLSFEKICRMYKSAVENGYTSYAEA
jgi:5-methylcytosine-specific restriction protein B